MGVKYEVTAVTGKYTDKDGNEKNRYQKIGVILETKNGFMLKQECVPIGWDGWAYLNEPKEQPVSTAGRPGKKNTVADMPDDIPF